MLCRRICCGTVLLIAVLLSSCNSSSLLFSESDRRSIYTLSVSTFQGKLVSGSVLEAGSELTLSLSRMTGSSIPSLLSLELQNEKTQLVASLNYATADSSKDLSAAVEVASLSDELPPFQIPENLGPGCYSLVAYIKDKNGTELQRSEILFFIGGENFGLGGLSLLPASPYPGQAVLFRASVNGSTKVSTLDPWFRWSFEGKTLAMGPLSEGFDKIVWKAPLLEGAYSVDVDLYPTQPSVAALAIASPWRQAIKCIIARDPGIVNDLFNDTTNFLSWLSFETEFADLGSRLQSEKVVVLGKPLLEAFPGGFGYRLDDNASVSLPGLIPPVVNDTAAPFSLLWRIYSPDSTGSLMKLVDVEGKVLLRAGLNEGRPYLEANVEEGLKRTSADFVVKPGLIDFGLSLEPKAGKYRVTWSINGTRLASSSLLLPDFPDTAKAILGGAGALPGIYDEFAMSLDLNGRPPLYRSGLWRERPFDFILAEGFESLPLRSKAVVTGALDFAPGALDIGASSSLSFEGEVSLSRPIYCEVNYVSKGGLLALEFSNSQGLAFSVSKEGQLRLGDGSLVGLIRPQEEGKLAFIVKSSSSGLEILGTAGVPVARIEAKQGASSLHVALANRGASGSVSLSSFLLRAAPEAISSADSSRMARLQ